MAHRVLAHTADTGVEATADSFPALVAELAAGMFGLVASLPASVARRWITVRVAATTREDLVVDTLSELIYRAEVENLVFCAFRVQERPDTIELRAGGVPADEVEAEGAPIKAVTYHDLVVREEGDGWYGRVYLDV